MNKLHIYIFSALLMISTGCSNKNAIEKTIMIGNLEVAYMDFSDKMNWQDAQDACAELGDGWRLPSRDELSMIYSFENNTARLSESGQYWSNTQSNPGAKPSDVYADTWSKRYFEKYENLATHAVQAECLIRTVRSL